MDILVAHLIFYESKIAGMTREWRMQLSNYRDRHHRCRLDCSSVDSIPVPANWNHSGLLGICWAEDRKVSHSIQTAKGALKPYLKLFPNPRDCCNVWANISYLRMSLSETDRRANFIASSKCARVMFGTGSSSSICME